MPQFRQLTIALIMLLPLSGFAASPTHKNYKGEIPSSATSPATYKGIIANAGDSSNYVPAEAKYGGQVYDSDLFQGPIEAPGYTATGNRSLHDGFYVGAQLGYDSYKMHANINTMSGGISVFQQTPELNAVGLSYTALGGYGRVFDDPIYLGAELFYNSSQASTDQNISVVQSDTGVYNIKSLVLGNYGVNLLPGIKLGNSTLLFLKAGYTRVEAKTYETSTLLGVNNAQSNGVNGFDYGLGFEVALYKIWSVRGEYTHITCKSFTTSVGTKITPSDNQVMFGVVLHFV